MKPILPGHAEQWQPLKADALLGEVHRGGVVLTRRPPPETDAPVQIVLTWADAGRLHQWLGRQLD